MGQNHGNEYQQYQIVDIFYLFYFLLSWYLTEFVSVVISTNRRNIETLDVEVMSNVTRKIGLERDGKFPPYPCSIILSSDV